ncbi:Z1 domain-containing protein [Exiguobacterium artemiae]|uniref:Z1 domain-containing protein n=1 Tax=Exiguobacterium artemiae TaxID=340145 RepID=UPI0029642686|nr:Z1 domain-containing protein [Exiguobacterium sibiricum]MDW2886668.1 Z1 domain-containing protein [Exiguobacterium sibiricum]
MGANVEYFKKRLTEEIGEVASDQVLNTALEIFTYAPKKDNPERVLGLLYGLVQSGKTNIINMTTAIAIDNSFRLSIILTDRNNTLQTQTVGRSEDALCTPYIKKISELEKDDMGLLDIYVKTDGLVIISKKDPNDLEKLNIVLSNLSNIADIPTLIIDDEADAIGLNTKQRNEDSEHNVSTINAALVNLRDTFSTHLMLQVTATPQAIILQNDVDGGFHPEFVVLSKAGEGYVGIDEFFSDTNSLNYIRNVNLEEVQELKAIFDENVSVLPQGLLFSLNTFIVAGAIKILEEPNSPDNQFTYLSHISHSQQVHETLRVMIKIYIRDLTHALKIPTEHKIRTDILNGLNSAYEDVVQTCSSVPIFSEVLEAIEKNIASHDVLVVNSSPNGIRELNFNKRFNFVIGGNRLNRGITLPRLLVTYYGRSSNRPQIDTLFQHARMCGYRSKDLSVTRIFIPEELASIFATISDHDSRQRELIESGEFKSILYLDHDVVKPTRPSVIPTTVGIYKPGKSTFPKIPEFNKSKIELITTYIDTELSGLPRKEVISVDVSLASNILSRIPLVSAGSWNEKVICSYLNTYYVQKYSNEKINLIITEANVGLATSRGSQALGSILSPTTQDLANSSDPSIPLVILTRNPGVKPEWNDAPFWIPWFRFPDNESHVLFNVENF